MERDHSQHRDAGKNDQRQRHIQRAEIDKGEHDHADAGEQVFRAVVGQLADLEQVGGQAGHDPPGLVLVEEGEGQPLQMGKHIPPHLGLHLRAHHMAVILHEIAQQHPHRVKRQQNKARQDDGGIGPVGDVVVEHPVGHHGIDHADDGDQQGSGHIHGKQPLVGPVVGNKALEHEKVSSSG